MLSYQYRSSHCGDKTVVRPSYFHNGISYTGKITYLYWIRANVTFGSCIKTRPRGIMCLTLKPRQNGRRFAGDILNVFFLYVSGCILIKISSKIIPNCPIKNTPALVYIIRRQATMMTLFTDAYASLGLGELKDTNLLFFNGISDKGFWVEFLGKSYTSDKRVFMDPSFINLLFFKYLKLGMCC